MRVETKEDRIGTRAKILEACRTLFNERGPAEVTTAEIAQAVGISEGNLHYHFRRKQQIVVALFDGFETALEAVGRADRLPAGDGAYRQYLAEWFNLMWEWRCFYGASVYRLAPALTPRLMALTDRGQAKVRQALAELVSDGRLVAEPEALDRLVVNAWIVATYWIDYLRTRQGVAVVTREHLAWGFAQVQALFMPYATDAGAASRGRRGPVPGAAAGYVFSQGKGPRDPGFMGG
jgi:AcrR family transcriptional regulator